MKKNNISIGENYINDKRLYPLTDASSKVVLQLFVLQTTNDKVKTYDILYGLCVLTTRPEISDQVNSNDFKKITSIDSISYEVSKVSIYNYSGVIIKFVNEFLSGKSLKASALSCNLDVKKMKYDFSFRAAINSTCAIRPIIFNETNSNVSRNLYEKFSLHSPYGNTPSFSLIITNLDKLGVLRDSTGQYFREHKEVLLSLLKYLSDETSMAFSTTECSRFGNIEFINTQCADIYEYPQVYFENLRTEENLDGYKVKTSKQVKVTIASNKITDSKKILVNCFSRNGGQVILDEIKECFHEEGETLEIIFDTSEPISDLVVSAWIEDGNKWQIWFKHSAVLIRNIVTKMGMVGSIAKVSSPFLDKILLSGKHLKNDVEKAMEINKTSYQTMSVGNRKLDPWVESDDNFNALVQSIVVKKSNAEFFPKGWNVEIEEHGALAFLEWFKRICDQASNVLIQDPYFDTVGLEFLARTSNSSTSFNVITCTQTPSSDDDKVKKKSIWQYFLNFSKFKKTEKPILPNRASRLISMLTGLPELFSSLKLTVYDYRNKSGKLKNLLHDRYIIVYENGQVPKGFHLSNSIQNATQNYPLLITPIPLDVLQSVEKYSADLLDEGNRTDTFEMVQLYDYQEIKNKNQDEDSHKRNLPPDGELFAELKSFVKTEEDINYNGIKQIFESNLTSDELKFEKFWDTFGYFLAHVPSDGILHQVKDWFLPIYSYLLKNYIQKLARGNNSNKFSNDTDLSRSGYHLLFLEDFDKALEASFRAENNFFENYGFGNYAARYASWALLNINIIAFEELLKSLGTEILMKKETENLNGKPVLKITAILFADIAKSLFWHCDSATINICLLSEVMPLRTLAIAAVATDAVEKKEEMTFEKVKVFFSILSFEEEVKAYVALLHQTRFDRGISQEQLRTDCFNKILQLLTGKKGEVVFDIIDRIVSNRYFKLIEALTTNNILIPLVEAESISIYELHRFWCLKFKKELQEYDAISKNSGVLDLVGWSISVADGLNGLDFVNSLAKISKRYFATIRKPFMSGTTVWENDYSRLLMIQTVAMIAINYLKSCQEVPDELSEKLNYLVDEVKSIKTNYSYFRDYNESHLFNKQIAEKDFI